MSYWLIVFLFTAEGEFVAKDVYETASKEQCEKFAGDVTRTNYQQSNSGTVSLRE